MVPRHGRVAMFACLGYIVPVPWIDVTMDGTPWDFTINGDFQALSIKNLWDFLQQNTLKYYYILKFFITWRFPNGWGDPQSSIFVWEFPLQTIQLLGYTHDY
jgi:hypothetical protein